MSSQSILYQTAGTYVVHDIPFGKRLCTAYCRPDGSVSEGYCRKASEGLSKNKSLPPNSLLGIQLAAYVKKLAKTPDRIKADALASQQLDEIRAWCGKPMGSGYATYDNKKIAKIWKIIRS